MDRPGNQLKEALGSACDAMERSCTQVAFGPPVSVAVFDLAGMPWEASAVWMVSGIHRPRLPASAQCFVVAHPAGSPAPLPDEATVCAAGAWPLSLAQGWLAIDPGACERAMSASLEQAVGEARRSAEAIALAEAAQLAGLTRAGGKASRKGL